MINNVKISGLPENTNPNLTGFTTVLEGSTVYKTSLQTMKNTIGGAGVSIQETCISFVTGSTWGTMDLDSFINLDDDDGHYEITLPWTVTFLGQEYDKVYLGTNSYLTFGDGSDDFHPIYPGNIPVPAIFVGAGDNGLSNYYTGTILNGSQTEFRIRYEGWNDTGGNATAYTQVWEAVFVSGVTDEIKIIIDDTLRNPGGTWGISDGSRWIEEFNGLPFYDAKEDNTYYGLLISPISTASASELKITGPGVTTDVDGDVVYINVDPLGQAGIGVAYDDDSGKAIIASKRYDLSLTTGENGEPITIEPNGPINIRPKNPIAALGANYGFNIEIGTPNATDGGDGTSVRQGGDILISTGNGTHGGRKGRMSIDCDIQHNGVINGVKKYVALVNYNVTTGLTSINILENTLNGSITFVQNNTNEFTVTSSGLFTTNKTFVLMTSPYDGTGTGATIDSTNQLRINFSSYSNTLIIYGDVTGFIEIRVYP
jgi:hypothetical protein